MRRRQASLIFILTTLFIDMLGVGLVFPILPTLVKQVLGGDLASASAMYGLLTALYGLMQFLCAPILGSLSDRFGRRPVILLALLGLGVDYLILAFATNIWWLVFGRVWAGVLGATITPGSAYIADISPPEKRAQNFGMIGAAFGLGFIAGPLLGGLLGQIGLRVPFLAAAGLVGVNALFGLFVLPESLSKELRRPFQFRQANPLGALLKIGGYPGTSGLLGGFVLVSLAQRGLEAVWVLYTGYRYGWDPAQVGLSLAAVGVLQAVMQGAGTRVILPRLGERRAVVLGLTTNAVAFALYGLAPQGWMIYPIMLLGVMGGAVCFPAMQGLLSGAVPATEQGLLQGAIGSINSGSSIIGSPLATLLFAFFVSSAAPLLLPGAPLLFGAVLSVAGLLWTVRSFATVRQQLIVGPVGSTA